MERPQSLKLSRRAFTLLAATTVTELLIGCSRLPLAPRPQPDSPPPATPVIKPPRVDVPEGVHDYCKPPEESPNPVSQYLAGMVVQSKEVIAPPLRVETGRDEIDSLNVTRSNIITGGRGEDLKKVQALIVPIKYPKDLIRPRMKTITTNLEKMFEGVDIEFPFFDTSVHLGVTAVDQVASVSEIGKVQSLAKKLRKVFVFDQIIFVANVDGHMGASHKYTDEKADHILVSGNGPNLKYRLGHEIGHLLGLNDAYTADYLANRIPNEELFPGVDSLSELTREISRHENAPIVPTGGVCSKYGSSVPIYTFYYRTNEEVNLMKSVPVVGSDMDKEIDEVLRQGKKVVDMVQYRTMQVGAWEVVAKRKAA